MSQITQSSSVTLLTGSRSGLSLPSFTEDSSNELLSPTSFIHNNESGFVIYNEGQHALQSRDLNKLKQLLDSNLGNIYNFLEKFDLDKFFLTLSGAKEADLKILEWLLDVAHIPDEDLQALFVRAVSHGDDGLPILNILFSKIALIDNAISWSDLFIACLQSESVQKGQGLLVIKWLVEKRKDKLPKVLHQLDLIDAALKDKSWKVIEFLLNNFECASPLFIFEHALMLGKEGLPLLKMVWEKAPPDKKTYDSFADALMNFRCKDCIPEQLDFLLEKLFLLLGTPFFPDYYGLKLFSSDTASQITTHLNKKGIEGVRSRININFQKLFKELGADGLLFFEEICKKNPELPPYSIRWAFLKAASHGNVGLPLMEWLAKNASKKLSYWTMAKACLALEKSGNVEAASKIKALQASLFKEGETTPLDNIDIQLELSLSKKPSGYRPLGDIPERAGWRPLTQTELDEMAKGSSIAEETSLFDASVEIVEDSAKKLLPHQIRKSEAKLFSGLYSLIKQGKTPIQIDDSNANFKTAVLNQFKKLLSRPSGRWLLLFICRHAKKIPIKPSPENAFLFPSKELASTYLGIDFNRHNYQISQQEKNNVLYQSSLDVGLFHELLHALHFNQDFEFSYNLALINPSDEEYDNLEEQYTIAGVDEDSVIAAHFALSENTYNCEWGYKKRYGHKGGVVEELSESQREVFDKDPYALIDITT